MTSRVFEFPLNNQELSTRFPVSWFIVPRRTIVTLGCLVTVFALLMAGSFLGRELNTPLLQEAFLPGLRMALLAMFAIWTLRAVYEALARSHLEYRIEHGHLVISRGVLLKQRGVFPLPRIADVYVESTFLDLFFGLHTLHIATPTTLSEQFARIDGLSYANAEGLQEALVLAVEHASHHEEPHVRESIRSNARRPSWHQGQRIGNGGYVPLR